MFELDCKTIFVPVFNFEIYSDFNTNIYYFSIIISKSFLFIQDFMQKKNSEDPPESHYINYV